MLFVFYKPGCCIAIKLQRQPVALKASSHTVTIGYLLSIYAGT